MKRPKQTLARLAHPDASSTLTSAPLAPAPLGTAPPPSPRMQDTSRSRTPPPDPHLKGKGGTKKVDRTGSPPFRLVLDAPFFTVAPQKGKEAAPKGGKKGKNKGKDKGGQKGKGKGKGKGPKRLTEPDRRHLGWSWDGSSISSFASLLLIQQRAEKAAGLSSVDGCQVTVEGAI